MPTLQAIALLADNNLDTSNNSSFVHISDNLSIGQSDSTSVSSSVISGTANGISEVDITHSTLRADSSTAPFTSPKTAVVKSNQNQIIDICEGCLIPVTARETSSYQDAVVEISSTQIAVSEASPIQISPFETSPFEVGVVEHGFDHLASAQVSSNQDNSSQVQGRQSNTFEVNPREVSLSTFDSSPEFFSIHNSTPQIINELSNSATNIWSDLLESDTKLDIDFQITDLPTGQLAEATITGFNDSGTPNTGTILIDHNANGVGWFIDPTPLDNFEFITQGTDS